MTKFIRQYRALVSDLDYSFKVEGGMGYKALTFCTLLVLGGLAQSVVLDLRWMGVM